MSNRLNTNYPSSDRECHQMSRQSEATAKRIRKQTGFRRVNKDDAEIRSRRVQLLVKPSIYERLLKIAAEENVSVNQMAERSFLRLIDVLTQRMPND